MLRMTRKLYMLLILAIIAVLVFSTATYAWFSSINIVGVEISEIDIEADDGLEVALLNQKEIYFTKTIQPNSKGIHLRSITSTDGKTFRGLEIEDVLKDQYLSFQIKLRSKTPGVVVLSNVLSTSIPTPFAPKADVTLNDGITYGPDQENKIINTVRLADAMRISFVNKLTNEPIGIHIVNEDLGQGNYETLDIENKSYNPALQYYNEIKKTNLNVPDIYHSQAFTNQLLKVGNDIITLEKEENYYTATLTINIWAEGWDADCLDSNFEEIVSMSFKLSKKEE